MMQPKIIMAIQAAARAADVDTMLALAIAEVESAGDPLACRFEPGWKYHYNVEQFARQCRITPETERILQSCSFGVMQVMGTVARELGFSENILKLADVNLGAKYGCLKLKSLKSILRTTEDVIAAYNAGTPRRDPATGKYMNQAYVDKVLKLYRGGKFSDV